VTHWIYFYSAQDVVVGYRRGPPSKPATICITPACVVAASEIIQNMSPRYHEIDPCSNFDKFVCEGWKEKHDLRADQESSFTGTIMQENSQQVLRHVLESPYSDVALQVDSLADDPEAEKAIFDKLKGAYDGCMDEQRIQKIGSGPLLDILRKIQELFPASRPHESSQPFPSLRTQQQKGLLFNGENQLSKTVSYLTTIGINAIVSFSIGADDRDPDSVVLSLTAPRQPGLPSKEYYKDAKLVKTYGEVIGQVLEGLLHEAYPNSTLRESKPSRIFARSEDLVEAVIDFETKLARATPDTEDAEDVVKYYNPRTVEETRSLFPQLSVQYVISVLAPSDYKPDRIIVGSPSYLKLASEIFRNAKPETIQAYFVWKAVQAYVNKVEDDALKPLLHFNNQLGGKAPDASEERWRTCVKVADNSLGWILSKFFIKKAFSEEAKDFGDHIVSDIKEQFIKKLKAAEWMTKDVRTLGVEKVHNIVQKIGYPTKSPDVHDSIALEKYYAAVNISSSTFFENAVSVAKFDTSLEWSALGKPTDRAKWGMTAPTVNAYYNPAGNEIVFPAGIMQAPVFYDPSIPQYLSYGAFGSVSGHELSHAFDSTGRHYDQTGNFTEWWNNNTIQAFKEKAQCFIDQYHEFTVPGPNNEVLHVNGRLTLGENIADAGGLSASFQAWKQLDKQKPAQLLPGLQDFTKEQLFFISYSNWWCGKTRKEAAINGIYRDPHAPNWARIIVSSNLPDTGYRSD